MPVASSSTTRRDGIITLTERHRLWFTSEHNRRNRLWHEHQPGQFPTYKSLLPVLKNQTTSVLKAALIRVPVATNLTGFVSVGKRSRSVRIGSMSDMQEPLFSLSLYSKLQERYACQNRNGLSVDGVFFCGNKSNSGKIA